jgi:lipopolysaccharide assembly outer membrane protein LptD (OstA)
MQVRFGQAVGLATLTDYKDTSISPTISWTSSERDKLTLSASVGRYNSLDDSSESRSANLEIGFSRSLSELWSLTANAGYSRALNRLSTDEEFLVLTPEGPAVVIIPIKEEYSQNGTVYSVDLGRKGERLSIDAIASRQLVPTGFAFLSKQNSAELTATYALSDRWSVSAAAQYVQAQDPQLEGGIITRTPKYLSVSANWSWTEFWTVTFSASRIAERFQPPDINFGSNEVSLKISRKFNHIKF